MDRSRRALVVAAAALVAASGIACSDLLGLGDYGVVMGDAATGGLDAGADEGVAQDATPPEDATTFDVAEAGPIEASLYWAQWPMPNPSEIAFDAGLPNPSKYDGGADGGVVTDTVTGLLWQTVTMSPGQDCAATFGPGWRLPTRIELVSLIDYARQRPAIDPTFVLGDSGAAISTPFATGSGAWVVNFATGEVNTSDTAQLVRCVSQRAP